MALTPIPPIDPILPDPPNPLDSEALFDAAAYAWSAALPGFGSDLVAIGAATYANAGEALTAATTATDKAVLTAADRVQTGIDRVQTGLDAAAALTSANNAETSRLGADKRYLGAKASAPTLDNQGAALQAGAVYYDTTTLKVMTWTGSAWVEGISAVAGVSSVNGNTGDVTVQPTLVSGTNIKTVNGFGLLGSGDLAIASNMPTVTSFTASGTFTKQSTTNFLIVRMVGAGGGSAGATNQANFVGGSGGGGGFASLYIPANSITAPVIVTIGAGGAAGSSTTNGTVGGTTSFGAFVSATGGSGGKLQTGNQPGASGGVGIGGNINICGGGAGTKFDTRGGSSVFGGENPGSQPETSGLNGVGYGTGASGAISVGVALSGGVGANGFVIIEEFV